MTLFLKLGGSLLTDKRGEEAVRGDVLSRLASEIAAAQRVKPELRLVLGHGSGSFAHLPAKRYGTRQGVSSAADWMGFSHVAAAAARLNRLVVEALITAGLPAISIAPSASCICEDGEIVTMAAAPIETALAAGLLPVVYGDVAFDSVRGGTIVSTEEVLSYLALHFRPTWLLLAGETAGVLESSGDLIDEITPQNIGELQSELGGSRGTDVTGGMASKVGEMLTLCGKLPGLRARIFNGLQPDLTRELLLGRGNAGTVIRG